MTSKPLRKARESADLVRLQKTYGHGSWRKMKGLAAFALLLEKPAYLSSIGTKLTESEGKNLNVRGIWSKSMKRSKALSPEFVVCINNKNYPASLELHKIYRVIPDADAAADGDLRVIDESGEDYLYPASLFAHIEVPQLVEESLLRAP